jgi:tRNA(fMet)-specific endonuclease VapC
MILLDTDHISVLQNPDSGRRDALIGRMARSDDQDFGTTIVNVEEQLRGWLATIAKERQVSRHVAPYRRLAGLFNFYQGFAIRAFDEAAASKFADLRKSKVKIASTDLKIASTAIVNDCLLLTANRQHFEKVPGLRFENWLD